MSDICAVCGLPKDLCICTTLAKEKQKIYIYPDRRRYGKIATFIEGLDPKQINLKQLAKKLKESLACGGTLKDNKIELQGNHLEKVKSLLVDMGFSEDSIEVKKNYANKRK